MENLNDVEFGSDKKKEEAPILVAQRYLNIYRQIHIFSKEKRDTFDDELLALPPQITEFFKRMPGGRLLVEHMEEVKTQRGIAFVKANKEDFAEGSGKGTTPSPTAQGGAVGVPMVGGSITVDASFAETLAKSLAEAFKQNSGTVSSGIAPIAGGKIDFGNAFDIIAEEIRTSRASLLDVLKETRSITDSVIASQVSISRILEGILSQRTKDDIGVADLNNRIIASQTSITKLLEGLYMAKDPSLAGNCDYQYLDNKLQNIKDEVRLEMERSVKKMEDLISSFSLQTSSAMVSSDSNVSNIKDSFDFSQNTNFNDATITSKPIVQNVHKDDAITSKTVTTENPQNKPQTNVSQHNIDTTQRVVTNNQEPSPIIKTDSVNPQLEQQDYHEEEVSSNVIIEKSQNIGINETNDNSDNASQSFDIEIPETDSLDDILGNLSSIDEIIEQDNTNREETSSVETIEDTFVTDDIVATEGQVTLPNEDSLLSESYNADDGLDFGLPEQNKPVEVNEIEPVINTFNDDGLGFSLPEQSFEENGEEDVIFKTPENFVDDGLNYELPQHEIVDDSNTLQTSNIIENNIVDDGLAYDLPSEPNLADVSNFEVEEPLIIEDANIEVEDIEIFENTDEQASVNEDVFENPIDENNVEDIDSILPKEDIALDDFFNNDDTEDTSLPSENEVGLNSLDAFISEENNIDELIEEDNNLPNFEAEQEDNQFIEQEEDSVVEQPEPTQSRYSNELDKIRRALTSDDIDISSLDKPIALDDYLDDENVSEEDDFSANIADNENLTTSIPDTEVNENSDEEWEWDYVDEDGNPISSDGEGEDWEWEYVEEDENSITDDNKTQ